MTRTRRRRRRRRRDAQGRRVRGVPTVSPCGPRAPGRGRREAHSPHGRRRRARRCSGRARPRLAPASDVTTPQGDRRERRYGSAPGCHKRPAVVAGSDAAPPVGAVGLVGDPEKTPRAPGPEGKQVWRPQSHLRWLFFSPAGSGVNGPRLPVKSFLEAVLGHWPEPL
ncbi:hypothetical protein mRhiFer1_010203 [Rhinolophus ferrumequinum]|uniref:Uncharacterized protein n=1 Tax=Rhinolophus ferrumequinum TaxID=59479 RepID=A0A7J7X568_RHIFE|nr:serine/arginine repetitive matrix protein 3-like isoform X2 [Rhinolophus ferrumequinum]KAF6344825.1 hypothetical protein mRhiFer1_010203 [Rhinolophus ferrumequinum]